jgi:cytoskeleton protein RodZ
MSVGRIGPSFKALQTGRKMTLDHNSLSFGQYLKAVRLQKGIELELVSKETRVGMDNLRHIENEAHDMLPAAVFVKGFLRAYAQAVGVAGDDVVRRYEDSLQAEKTTARAEADFKKLNRSFWPRILLALGMLIALIAVAITLAEISSRLRAGSGPARVAADKTIPAPTADESDGPSRRASDAPAPSAQTGTAAGPSGDTAAAPQALDGLTPPVDTGPAQETEAAPGGPISDNLHLEIFAREETWMKITIDDSEGKEFLLKAGDRLELSASSRLGLFVGNAGGIALLLNDEPLPPLGRSGQVVTLQLP